MYQETTLIDAEKLFGNLTGLDSSDGFETCWEWPKAIGSGHISMLSPRSGISMEIGKYRLQEDIAISFEQAHPSIYFGFSVSGDMKHTIDSNKGPHDCWDFKQGKTHMGYLPRCRQNIVRPSTGIPTYSVLIAMDPSLLKSFSDEQIPAALQNIVDGDQEQYFHEESTMPPAINLAVQQIINCPYRASLKRLFLEGKALELISYSLAQPLHSRNDFHTRVELLSSDVEWVRQARDILIRDLENPPSLQGLAKQVGTNKNKLNKGFQQVFGTSIFDYLRIHRLERARELLSSNRISVGEAAALVGYSHQSSFTRAFKKHFGNIPTAPF